MITDRNTGIALLLILFFVTSASGITALGTTIDSVPPVLTNNTSAAFSFSSSEVNSTFECQLDSSGYSACTTPKVYKDLSDGSHIFYVQAIDEANNPDPAPASYTWTVDAAAPNTIITSKPPAVSNSAIATFEFTSTRSGTFECKLDTKRYSTCTTPKVYSGLSDGSHTFYVRATKGAGITDSTPAIWTWTIDTTAPVWSSTPSNQIVQVGVSFSYDVSATDASTIEYSINDTINFHINSVSGLITNATELSEGTYGLNIAATDSLDNSISRMITVTVQAQPTYSVSGYVFDNNIAGLVNVNIQSGTKQATSSGTGYYVITGLLKGRYNFSYSKPEFNTEYSIITISGSDVTNANKTIFDTTPPDQVTGLVNDTPTQTTVNLGWNSTANASQYQIFRNSSLIGTTHNTYWNDNGLKLGTLYQYWVRANDSYNNYGQNSSTLSVRTALTATTPPPPSRGAGGGGGGGGGGVGTSGENFSNIIVKERYDKYIYKDIITSYKFSNINNPILSIDIVGNVNAGEIVTAVEVLRNTSSLVINPAPGNVYKNVNMWVGTSGFGTSKNIKQAVITFKVENLWFSSNNMKSGSIKMIRWDGSKWNQLETSEKSKDSAYSYFEAKTDSFSSFAITGIENKEYITEKAIRIESNEPSAAIATTQPEQKKSDFLMNWLIIIGVLFAIGLIIEMYQRMKNK